MDRTKCTGHGMCYMAAPDVLNADDDGYVVVVPDELPEAVRTQAELAVAACP